MSVQTIVLYGNRLYDKETYSTNQDPQSLNATLSDSISMSDTDIQNTIKAIADAITMAEIWKTSGNKPLTDSVSMAETFAKALVMATFNESISMSDSRLIAATKALADAITIADTIITTSGTKALSESLTMTETRLLSAVKILTENLLITDSKVAILQIKGLSDFILMKDWIELKWQRANVWSATPAYHVVPSRIHNYGPGVYYGVDFYSSNPSVNWLLSMADQATWIMPLPTMAALPLYAKMNYGASVYSSIPEVAWAVPANPGRQNWQNADGESHN